MSFLPGHVEMVFTSADEDNPLTTTAPEVGKIKLTPYSSDSTGVAIDAIPLLRGVQDSITRGDLVLYTNIGGQNFYLGPINTRNIPSNSSDHMYGGLSTGKDRPDGYNRFISNLVYDKLSKPRNPQMDFPAIYNSINTNSVSYLESNVTDLMLEGRSGNAIRIGNRYDNPLIILSNNNSNDRETLGGGGSIFAMTSIGTIDNNFPTEAHDEIENKFNYRYGFIKDYDPEELAPNNEFDQIIISSDRIIFNSTVEDITVSSNRNINIGSNKNLTINNKGFSVFQSQNIYIGEAAKQRVQPMVLGDQLQKLLVRILRLFGDAYALGDMNVPQKLTLFPNIHIAGTLSQEVDNIMQEFNLGTIEPGQNPAPEYENNLDENGLAISDTISGQASFLSNRHFIEPNRISDEQQNQNQTGDGGQVQGPPPPPPPT